MALEVIKEGFTRVSEILSLFVSYAHIDPKVLKRKCQIGNDVHKAIECYVKGEFYPLDDASMGYFNSFESWYLDVRPKVVAMEERLYGVSIPVTGKFDLAATIDTEYPIILDFKTSFSANEPVWMLQGWFYWLLAKENGMQFQDQIIFIKLDKKGGAPEIFKFEFTERSEEVCRGAFLMWEHFKLCKNPLVNV